MNRREELLLLSKYSTGLSSRNSWDKVIPIEPIDLDLLRASVMAITKKVPYTSTNDVDYRSLRLLASLATATVTLASEITSPPAFSAVRISLREPKSTPRTCTIMNYSP